MLLSSSAIVGMVGSSFAGGLELVLLVSSSVGGSKFMSSGVCGMLVIVCIVLGERGRAVLFVLNMLHVGRVGEATSV